MAEMKEYRSHYIIYGATEVTSGFWEVSLTIADADPDMTVKTISVDKSFSSEEEALSYAFDYGKKIIDTIENNNSDQS